MAMLNPYNYKRPRNVVNVKSKKKNHIHVVKNKSKSKEEQYLEQKIMAAQPEQLTFMLYGGLVKFLKKGKLFMSEKNKDIQKVNTNIQRAQAILNELRSTLDMDIEISNNLDSIYEYMNHRAIEANINKDIEILDEVIGLAEELKETWEEIM